MVTEVRSAVTNALNTTIREGQVTTSISNINAICKYRVDADLTNSIVPVVLNAVIKPNMVIDEVATEAARQVARDSVEPVIYKQGQNIVREGERVSGYQIAMLSALGLLDSARVDLNVYGGAALVVIAAVLLMVLMLLAAAAGFLWLSGLGEKLINGASNIVETLSSSTVSIEAMTVSPEHAALPAKLTFHLKTDATITELRLVTADGSQLPADASVTIAENGLDWECKCTLTEPYTGTVYAELLCADGQWRKASESCYIEIN
jgi:hypothetical protein